MSSSGIRWVEIRGREPSLSLIDSSSSIVPSGLLEPSFSRRNAGDVNSLKEIIINTIPSGKKKGDIGLSIPDHVAKISYLEFDQVPDKRDEVEKLLLWRMKKSLPFSPDEAKVDYQIIRRVKKRCYIIASVAKKSIVQEYEYLIKNIGLIPRVVDISTINSMFFFKKLLSGNSFFVDISGNRVGISVINEGKLVFFRSKDFNGNIEAVIKETVSTTDYFSANNPDVSIHSLYLHSDKKDVNHVVNSLKDKFEGEVFQIHCQEFISNNSIKNNDLDIFSAALGAALKL